MTLPLDIKLLWNQIIPTVQHGAINRVNVWFEQNCQNARMITGHFF